MRLNGWQRMGVVISVVWCVSAFWYLSASGMKEVYASAADRYSPCFEGTVARELFPQEPTLHMRTWQQCQVAQYADIERDAHEVHEEAAIVAVVPVPFAWGAIYLVLTLTKWVRRGFEHTAS